MTGIPGYADSLKTRHRAEFGEDYDRLRFVSDGQAREAKALREGILEEIASDIAFYNKRTKPVYRGLSEGCRLCGTGSWSCLFINGKCNCRCFYCPTEQCKIGLPTTNTLTFPKVQDYTDYVQQLNFKGVSLSGGEPLLTLDATLKFLASVKKKLGDGVYLWIYTNGTLVDRDILLRLRDGGCNEIRFDIGATGYSLQKARLAVGVIDHVTVEIPAVPEDYGLMKDKLSEMNESGISFLNLHQLRLTPFNRANLIPRNYTYLHGEHLTVLESELAALKLVRHAAVNRIPLAVNYCSYVYKNRFQRAAARRRSSRMIASPHEDITENGHIRSLYAEGPAEVLGGLAESLERSGSPAEKWRVNKNHDRIYFSAAVRHLLPPDKIRLGVSYFDSRMVPSISYRNMFVEIKLNKNRGIFVERMRISDDVEIPESRRNSFEALIAGGEEPPAVIPPVDSDILRYETILPDLQDYA
jgi:pyruvate formate-lyase activating enzyme-like uncharacterized protein